MKRIKVLILVLAFLSVFLLGTLAVCSAAEERVIITLPESVNVQGSELLLGTIAELSGPEELVSKVAAVNAGAAPIAGSSRRLTRGQIEVRLRQGGIDPQTNRVPRQHHSSSLRCRRNLPRLRLQSQRQVFLSMKWWWQQRSA